MTTIFEQVTGRRVGDAFLSDITEPLGVQDFEIRSVCYSQDESLSIHAKVGIRMSVRDLAKFGQLYLNKGN